MAGRTLQSLVIAALIGTLCTILWIASAPTSQPTALVGYGRTFASTPGATNAPGVARGQTSARFSISGNVGGLFPGKTFPLVLTVTNPLTVTIEVSSITTTVSNASARCAAGDLDVTKFSGHLVVAVGKSAEATVLVTLRGSAPDACEGARFSLRYLGLASAVRR